MAAQDHALAQSPGTACPSGRKGLTVLVTLPLLAATRSACRHLTRHLRSLKTPSPVSAGRSAALAQSE